MQGLKVKFSFFCDYGKSLKVWTQLPEWLSVMSWPCQYCPFKCRNLTLSFLIYKFYFVIAKRHLKESLQLLALSHHPRHIITVWKRTTCHVLLLKYRPEESALLDRMAQVLHWNGLRGRRKVLTTSSNSIWAESRTVPITVQKHGCRGGTSLLMLSKSHKWR